MKRHLPAALIATFRDGDPAHHRDPLDRFSERHWRQAFPWLDASGLALYFLQRLKFLGLEDAIPDAILSQLERRQADNEQRTAFLLKEFARVNAAFRDAALHYVNLKGFTLVPGFCPNLSLRCQMDFDFLIREYQLRQCQDLLSTLGYSLIASNAHVAEFKSQASSIPHVRDLYKARPQHAIEVHLCDDSTFELQRALLDRSVVFCLDGARYPALSDQDTFLCQASHIFRHVRSEWTRVSWLLEFRHFVISHQQDAEFWNRVRESAEQSPGVALAVGVALGLTEKAFGRFAPTELREWSVETLPAAIGLWIERYGDELFSARFPGNKLYLILNRELDNSPDMSSTIRRRLLPMRAPARITVTSSRAIRQRVAAERFQLRYFCFRLRFHVVQTTRYMLEAWRWKRLLKALGKISPQVAISQKAAEHSARNMMQTTDSALTVKQQ